MTSSRVRERRLTTLPSARGAASSMTEKQDYSRRENSDRDSKTTSAQEHLRIVLSPFDECICGLVLVEWGLLAQQNRRMELVWRSHLSDRGGEPHFVAFDLLQCDGQNLSHSPLIELKQRLRAILPKDSQSILYCDHIERTGKSCSHSPARTISKAS